MKKVLYLHGLESKQGGKKVDFLSYKFIVHAPDLDYKDDNCFESIYKIIVDNNFDYIIGSSMGGYLGFTMGEIFNIPTILFNPALHSRSFEPYNNFNPSLDNGFHNIILGEFDTVISADKTIEFLHKNNIDSNVEIKPITHRTPLDVFIETINKIIE